MDSMVHLRTLFAFALLTAALASCASDPIDNETTEPTTPKREYEINVSKNQVEVSDSGEQFDINVETNVSYSVSVSGNWISEITPKALDTYTHSFVAEPLPGNIFQRSATISFASPDDGSSQTVTVVQKDGSPVIVFEDPAVKAICVNCWDKTGDGEISEREAAAVTDLGKNFSGKENLVSFRELHYFTGLTLIQEEAFKWCSSLESIIIPENVVRIGKASFRQCTSLKDIILPDALHYIDEEAFLSCESLVDITIPANVLELGQRSFAFCPKLARVVLLPETPPVYGDFTFIYQNFTILVPGGTATVYQEADGWSYLYQRITEEGHLPEEFYYRSVDFSSDGEAVCLQRATRGKGINMVFIGDGYLDKDMASGGKYEQHMRQRMENLFKYEPYRSFREWFSIYMVKVVSANRFFDTPASERKLTRTLQDNEPSDNHGNRIVVMNDVCQQYVDMVPNPAGQPRRSAVFLNTDNTEGISFCLYAPTGYCSAIILNAEPTTLVHELGGHGFGYLADEYTKYNLPFNNYADLEERWSLGMFLNVDRVSDPSTVRWARLLQDSRYANEGIGVFEGAYLYSSGLWRPSMNSLMRNDTEDGAVFNAPSRELIYKSIMRWGADDDWEYDYEAFVEADAAGRQQAAEAYSKYPPTKSPAIFKDDFITGLPPVLADDTVKEVIVSPDGEITLIH